MHILLIPDSFKDSISATDIVDQLALGFSEIDPTITTQRCIASDGGEGFLSFVQNYVTTTMISMTSVDPLGRSVITEYAFAKASKTAYIELAKTSGLELLTTEERNPLNTSTYGTGLQIKDAIERGAKDIFIGLGGSATNDGGTGIAQALGYQFFDKENNIIIPKGSNLEAIAHIIKPDSKDLPKIYAVNDVDNTLIGPSGASHIYGKQKGASPEEITQLDNGLKSLSEVVLNALKINEVATPGSGAAGGSAYGLKTFLNATFIPGVTFLTKLSGVEEGLKKGHIDLIITGEGSIDHQTLRGKLIKGVATLGKKYDVPVIAICGVNQLEEDTNTIHLGLKKIYAIADLASSKEDSIQNASKYIKRLSPSIYDYYKKTQTPTQ